MASEIARPSLSCVVTSYVFKQMSIAWSRRPELETRQIWKDDGCLSEMR